MATLAVGISLLMFACFMFIHSLSAVRDISVPSIKYELMKAIRAHSVCRMRLLFMDCEKVAFVGCVHFPRQANHDG